MINKKQILPYIYTPILLVVFYFATRIMHSAGNPVSIKAIAFGELFLVFMYLFFLGITGRFHIANLLLSIVFVLFFTASVLKIYYTNDPILFSDFQHLVDFTDIIAIANTSFSFTLVTVILPALIYAVGNVFIIVFSFKHKASINNIIYRVISVIAAILFFIIIATPSKNLRQTMLWHVFDVKGTKDDLSFSSNISCYERFGVVSGIYYHFLINDMTPPDGYNPDKLQQEAQASEKQSSSFGQPNIIVMFAESFWDIDKVEELQFSEPVLPNFARLKDEGISFEMISPCFGSTTANVEFEFLTGANLTYFGYSYIPSMQLYTNNNYAKVPSIVHELKNNGYHTKISVCTGQRLYNCAKFYSYAGLNEMVFNYEIPLLGVTLPEEIKKGGNISDEYIVDEIIREFNSKTPGQKEFYMTITMQGHSPYVLDKYEQYDVELVESPCRKSLNEALIAYAQGIHDTDVALGRLYDYIQTLEDPTLIVFFGDHLPSIRDELGNSMLNELSYFNTDDEAENLYRKYNTQALILANYDIPKGKTSIVGPDILSAFILNHMDIELSDYYRWLYLYYEKLPAMNQYVLSDSSNKKYRISDISGVNKQLFELRKQMQYYWFINEYQK